MGLRCANRKSALIWLLIGALILSGTRYVVADEEGGPTASDSSPTAEKTSDTSTTPATTPDLVVSAIHVKGSENVDSLIEGLFAQNTYFQTRVGHEIDLSALSQDIRRLYADYGPFKDVRVDVTPTEAGLEVTFLLTEFPRVKGDIELVGNKELSYSKLRKSFTLKDGERFSDYELWKTEQAVLKKYRDEGFYLAKVDAETEEVEGDEGEPAVRIRLTIDEGERIKVTEVRFEGNALISDKELRKTVQIREGKRFKDEDFEDDPNRILAKYHDVGCLNAKVVEATRDFSEDGKGISVLYRIEEGPQFVFQGYEIQRADEKPQVSENKIREQLRLSPGDVFNASTYRDDIARVQQLYSNRGNILAQVFDELQPDSEAATVRSILTITEGSTITIGEVRIEGLNKTKEYIIRRELERMDIAPGKPLKANNLSKAQQNIIQLGSFIQGLRFTPAQTERDDVKDLVVEMRENVRTGLFTVGGGYGSESGLFGVVEVGDGNLFGRAYRVNIRGELGQRRRRVGELSFATPWVLGTPTSMQTRLYSINRRRYLYGYSSAVTANNSYEDFRRGASLSLSTPITRDLLTFLTIRDESVEASYIPLVDSQNVDEFLIGARETRSVTAGIRRDTRRYRTSLFDPIGGGMETFSFEHSGGVLGGRNAFRKYTVEASRFIPSWWKLVLALHAQAGYLEDRSGVNPGYLFYERYWLGGIDTVRGFPDYSLIPARSGTKNVSGRTVTVLPRIGGNKMFFLNMEYRLPINEMIRGVAFLDAGQVWNEGSPNVFRHLDPQISVGVGVRMQLVAGFLIRLEWGVPITSVPVYNSTTGTITRRSFPPRLHFSMGPSF